MKKLIFLFSFIFLLFPFSVNADTSWIVSLWKLEGDWTDYFGWHTLTNTFTSVNPVYSYTWWTVNRTIATYGSWLTAFWEATESFYDASGDFSACSWVYPSSLTSWRTGFMSKRDGGADGWFMMLDTSWRLRVDFYANGGTYYTNTLTGTSTVNSWNHYCFTYDNTWKRVYLFKNGFALTDFAIKFWVVEIALPE